MAGGVRADEEGPRVSRDLVDRRGVGGEAPAGSRRRDFDGGAGEARAVEVARDVELREAERPERDLPRRPGRAAGRHEVDVDLDRRVHGIGEHEVGAEGVVLPHAEDRARRRADEVGAREGRDALAERPAATRRRGLPLDDEARRRRGHEDRAVVAVEAEEASEDVGPAPRLARGERHRPLRAASPVAGVPEELHRGRRGRGPRVPDREVRRPESAGARAARARGEKPGVRHVRRRADEGAHLREIETVGRELAGVDGGEAARVIAVVGPDDPVVVGDAVRRPGLRGEGRRGRVQREGGVLVDEADSERGVGRGDLRHGLPCPFDEAVFRERDVGGLGHREVALVVGHVARDDDDRVGPAGGAAPEEEDQLLQVVAVGRVVVVPEVVPGAGGESEVVAERPGFELAAALVEPGADRGPRDRRGRLGLRRRIGAGVGVVAAVGPGARAHELDRQVRGAEGEAVAERDHPAVFLGVVARLAAAAVVERPDGRERRRDVPVVLLDALARDVDAERLHRLRGGLCAGRRRELPGRGGRSGRKEGKEEERKERLQPGTSWDAPGSEVRQGGAVLEDGPGRATVNPVNGPTLAS